MRSSNIIVFCLLATAFYFLSHTISSSSPPTFLPGRRSLRTLNMSSSNRQDEYQQVKVNAEIKRSIKNLEDSMAIEHGIKEDAEELLYHIDYHGVMTHPTPIPKHP
ncbi:uncharacterized protein LOC132267412 [Cornus florida]|uniref:uncharacterized protein LOC132267412 n=1 Tax=Cornus florida TaxID=4283 RepID=UPI00289AA2F4|nr:uncharacterized protein LOC132267412 [Cornus florida]